MEDSPLIKLPQELRDRIYAIALHRDLRVILAVSKSVVGSKLRDQGTIDKDRLAFTMACKQMQREAMAMFFEVNSFDFHVSIFGDTHQEPDAVACRSQLSTCREWIDQTINKYGTSAGSIDIRLGSIHATDFTPVSRKPVVKQIVRTMKSANQSDGTRWTISLEISRDWLPHQMAMWWLPSWVSFDRVSVTDTVPRMALGGERDAPIHTGWPCHEQYLKVDVCS